MHRMELGILIMAFGVLAVSMAFALDLKCRDCGAKLGTVTYPATVSTADAAKRAADCLCEACAQAAQTAKEQAAAAATTTATDTAAKLLADVEKAETVKDLKPILVELVNKLYATEKKE